MKNKACQDSTPKRLLHVDLLHRFGLRFFEGFGHHAAAEYFLACRCQRS